MDKKIYKIFFQFLDELKELINLQCEESPELKRAVCRIELIREELEKSKTERDCDLVKTLMKKLEDDKDIGDLIKEAYPVAEYICYNKEY